MGWMRERVQAVEGGYTGSAVEKLAKLEELCEMLAASRCSSPGAGNPAQGREGKIPQI